MPVFTDREEQLFLEKLAQKLGRPTPEKSPPRTVSGPPDFWENTKLNEEELVQMFVENAEKLTVQFQYAADETGVQTKLGEIFAAINANSVLCWNSPELKGLAVMEACRALGMKVVLWDNQKDRQTMIRQCASVDVGITSADYGIAITGSLAILGSPLQSRSVSLLPPVHIAILNKKNIVSHMGDVLAKLNKTSMPSSVTFITGPSRTSDIEMDLALGVHGPGKVFIILYG